MKDTLSLYDDLIAGGCTESQARVQATQLGSAKDTLTAAIERIDTTLVKIEKDLFWMRLIGGAMTVAFMTNGLKVLFN